MKVGYGGRGGTLRSITTLAAIVLTVGCLCAAAKPLDVVGADKLLPYLESLIAWERNVASIDTTGTARESLLKDALTQSATNTLKSSFDFARTQAEILDRQAEANAPSDQDDERKHLNDAAARIAAHIADLQAQGSTLATQIRQANRKERPALQAKQDDLGNQLKLAAAQRDLIGNVLGVYNGIVTTTDGGLVGKINSLAETAMPATKPVPVPTATGSPAKFVVSPMLGGADVTIPTVSGGLLDMGKDMFKLLREMRDLSSLSQQTADLKATNKEFLDKLRKELRAATQMTPPAPEPAPASPPAPKAAASSAPKSPPAVAPEPAPAPAATENFDELLAAFKQLSTGIVPITQTNVWLDASARTLDQWSATLRDEMKELVRQLAIRLAILAVFLSIPIILAEIARRATERYVRDEKRKKQLRAIRRTLLVIAIIVIVIMNMVTQITSFATFAGFLTAGLAVAFQNVLLSLVAHFFFYGRYSVRAGDRVSVSGVIGDIVQIGMVRFYLRELEDKDGKLEPTGRVAAFPNSILFQASAFFKYV